MPKSTSSKSDEKILKFKTEITLICRGRLNKSTHLSYDEAETLANPTPNKIKQTQKKTQAKVFGNVIEFKNRLRAGDKKKKVLRYVYILSLHQLSTDNKIVVIQYEKPKSAYYFVLGFAEISHADDFIKEVKLANRNVRAYSKICNINAFQNFSSDSNNDDENEIHSNIYTPMISAKTNKYKYQNGLTDSDSMYSEEEMDLNYEQNGKQLCPAHFCRNNDGMVKESYISTKEQKRFNGNYKEFEPSSHNSREKHVPLGTSFAKHINNCDNRVKNCEYSTNRKDASFYINANRNHEPYSSSRNKNYYSQIHNHNDDCLLHKPKNQHYEFDELKTHRPKSRQIPLSEDERQSSGWHSDVLMVTPKPNGLCSVSADGPVMLYSARKTNINSSSEEEYSDDEDITGSYSSNSTINNEDYMGVRG